MGFEQYHEPANELSQEIRSFARMLTSLIEEAEAIGWYEQRISLEKDPAARGIMTNAQARGVQALRHGPRVPAPSQTRLARMLQAILFQDGDIVALGEKAEHAPPIDLGCRNPRSSSP